MTCAICEMPLVEGACPECGDQSEGRLLLASIFLMELDGDPVDDCPEDEEPGTGACMLCPVWASHRMYVVRNGS